MNPQLVDVIRKQFVISVCMPENFNSDGSINWDFVSSDVYLTVEEDFGPESLKMYSDIIDVEFEKLACVYDEGLECGEVPNV